MRQGWRPRRHVDLLPLRVCVILKQRLTVLPAGQRADAPGRGLGHALQTLGRGVAEDGALHVAGLDLGPRDPDLAIRVDDGLRDVERVVTVLAETQDYDYLVLGRAVADAVHLDRREDE